MEKIYQYLPEELVTFLLVTVFSLLIGLSLRRISLKHEGETTLFGTDRTFTFIGILGYLLYILDPVGYRLFMGGGAILGLLLALNYYVKQSQYHIFGITTIVIALITYCIAPIVATQPSWFYVMVIVTVLLFTELKHTFTELAQRMKNDEMITLAKFLAISGIILPMLPDEDLIPDIHLTPYSIWLATVVVSGISYLSGMCSANPAFWCRALSEGFTAAPPLSPYWHAKAAVRPPRKLPSTWLPCCWQSV